jgi:hypothetical protein
MLTATLVAFSLSACSGGPAVSDSDFCTATSAWGNDLSQLVSNMDALGNLLDSASDPSDPGMVVAMHSAGIDILDLAERAQADSAIAIANTADPEVIDAITTATSVKVDIAIVLGEAARDASDVDAFSAAILEHVSVFEEAANHDINASMLVIGDYGQLHCAVSPTGE